MMKFLFPVLLFATIACSSHPDCDRQDVTAELIRDLAEEKHRELIDEYKYSDAFKSDFEKAYPAAAIFRPWSDSLAYFRDNRELNKSNKKFLAQDADFQERAAQFFVEQDLIRKAVYDSLMENKKFEIRITLEEVKTEDVEDVAEKHCFCSATELFNGKRDTVIYYSVHDYKDGEVIINHSTKKWFSK